MVKVHSMPNIIYLIYTNDLQGKLLLNSNYEAFITHVQLLNLTV